MSLSTPSEGDRATGSNSQRLRDSRLESEIGPDANCSHDLYSACPVDTRISSHITDGVGIYFESTQTIEYKAEDIHPTIQHKKRRHFSDENMKVQ